MNTNKYIFEFSQYVSQPNIERSFGILGDLGKKSKFGEQTKYFRRLLETAASLGVDAFVFTDFDNSGVTAWKLNNGNWISERRALPKVFYNRSFKRRKNLGGSSSTEYLSKLGCIPLNSAKFRRIALDKHATYENLIHERLGDLKIPYTEKYDPITLPSFFQKRASAILKPRFGSGGKGIIKVSKNGKGYDLQYKDNHVPCPEDQMLEKIEEIRKKLKTSDKLYIVQEYVSLPKYQNSVFDIRVIYQKDGDGIPTRTGMAARIAAPNKVTANLHQGGGRAPLSEILKHLFNQDINGPIAEAIRTYSKNIFEILEKKVGPIGEIGIDFLIDQSGNIHLIEVNSVPGRNLFKILPEIRETAIKRPVEYAKYLLTK